MTPTVRWHVLGGGAIGCLWAAHLRHHAQVPVSLIVKPGTNVTRGDKQQVTIEVRISIVKL